MKVLEAAKALEKVAAGDQNSSAVWQAKAWLGRRPSAGRVVWQLGWHRGYRDGVTPAPVATTQSADVEI